MDNEMTRSTSGFTGTELPRESAAEYKTFPSLLWGRQVGKEDGIDNGPKEFISETEEYIMKILKAIKDIKFDNGVSEPIVMASAAGWYVGAIDNSEGFIQPYDRYTGYYATSGEAETVLDGHFSNAQSIRTTSNDAAISSTPLLRGSWRIARRHFRIDRRFDVSIRSFYSISAVSIRQH